MVFVFVFFSFLFLLLSWTKLKHVVTDKKLIHMVLCNDVTQMLAKFLCIGKRLFCNAKKCLNQFVKS